MVDSEPNRQVRLFVRSELPAPARRRRSAVVERLRAIGERSDLAVSVTDWPKRFECGGDHDIREAYSEFVDWARAEGVRLSPFFSRRECYSMSTGRKGEWVVLPVLCLVVYEDGDIVDVYPRCDGQRKESVEDGLDALAAADERVALTR